MATMPPTMASGMASTTTRLSFMERNSAAMSRNRTTSASAKFAPMDLMARFSALALPP